MCVNVLYDHLFMYLSDSDGLLSLCVALYCYGFLLSWIDSFFYSVYVLLSDVYFL
jgi:hypothetical protein